MTCLAQDNIACLADGADLYFAMNPIVDKTPLVGILSDNDAATERQHRQCRKRLDV
jgi:hypothetical protein